MKLTNAEYANAALTLNECGIIDRDLSSSLTSVMQMAGDVEYADWLEQIKADITAAPTKQHAYELVARDYGVDASRAVLALAVHS